MPEEIALNEAAHAVWQELAKSGPLDGAEIVRRTGIDQAQVAATGNEAAERGFFEVTERTRDELVPSDGALAVVDAGLPERRAAKHLSMSSGELALAEFITWAKDSDIAPNEVFKWGPARGWLERTKGKAGAQLVLTDAGRTAIDAPDDDERALRLADGKPVFLDDLQADGIDPARVQKLLGKRAELAKIKQRTERTYQLTAAGKTALANLQVVRERNTLSSEDLETGNWREITLRPYDVTLPARDVYPAKLHPLRKIMEETRRAFLEMGFHEVVSPMVESAFWNFDALFQPQDHPARDMQDTFYMLHPESAEMPDAKIVDAVKRVHEYGGDTGSEGWGYQFRTAVSQQVVLRTHTTAATIRALSKHPDPPGKFFCVGWTFRNETISFKHLPVFHQVDGIIIDEEANLASLLGTLQAFYSKMGFGRVKFKPAFYPYTAASSFIWNLAANGSKWVARASSDPKSPCPWAADTRF